MCTVTVDGSVNHKHLSSRNHKPEAGQGCLLDTPRHNADKYNDQQPLTIFSKHKHATHAHTFRSANVEQKIQTLKYVVTTAVPASYFRSKQIEEIACHLMTKEIPNQVKNESLLIPLTKEYPVWQSTLQFLAVGSLGENTAAATVPPSALSISINAAGCLTYTRNTARLNALAYNFPPSLSHLFWTKCSLPCSLPRRKRRRKRRRVQSWDHWQLDVTKVNWNNRFLCVYILNGPLVSAVLGSLQRGEAGEHCGYRAMLKVWGRHTHTRTFTHWL